MALRVKMNDRHQITVPAIVRKALHIESGDHILIEIRGSRVVLMSEPRDYSQHLRGLHREIWECVEPQEYVERERDAWAE